MAQVLKTAYAAYPSVQLKGFVTDKKTKEKKFGFIKELLFGDYLRPILNGNDYERYTATERNKLVEYIKVRARGRTGYLREEDFQAQRVLEVNFIDVGQGDGCHIVTPDDKHFIIDAGASDNMYRFLKWRFNLSKATSAPPPFTVVVSHSDADHYKGFAKIFDTTKGAQQQFKISKIFHNGLVELGGAGVDSLGTVITKNDTKYITDLCDTNSDFKKRSLSPKAGTYIDTLNKSTAPKQSLQAGSPVLYEKDNMKMEILAPFREVVDGKDALRVFDSNKGKTKNGHSVVIKLTIGNLKVLLGGDLNTDAEYHLLKSYAKTDIAAIRKQLEKKSIPESERAELESKISQAIQKARKTFEVDIAKSCHHGSADFTSEFLDALNPLATVISSGDDEPHTHPRPDTLGTIGKYSRGERSLIFCTELARSGKEYVELEKMSVAKKRERVVTVYGMINVRTDGEKVIIVQKLERPAAGRGYDIHTLEWNKKTKEFEYLQWEKYQ